MSQFKEREQTDSALYYYEPPQYFYEEGRSLKLRQTMGPFMVSFLFQCNPNNSHDLCEGTRMFQPQKKLHRWGPICRGKMGHFISSLLWYIFEVGHLVRRAKEMKDFIYFWLELGERIGHMAIEGEEELWMFFNCSWSKFTILFCTQHYAPAL